jgi:hypothetical protein
MKIYVKKSNGRTKFSIVVKITKILKFNLIVANLIANDYKLMVACSCKQSDYILANFY